MTQVIKILFFLSLMNIMIFPTLFFKKETQFNNFILFWSRFYLYPQENLYLERIDNKKFTDDDIIKLYTWKNGMNLSKKKLISLKKITDKIETINELKKRMNINIFTIEFHDVSSIWKIFLLHIIKPYHYPIFDQHVYRAFQYLKNGEIKELPGSNYVKDGIYFEEYLPFFNSLDKKGISKKKIDEALWAFGKFLKTDYADVILTKTKS